MNSYKQFAYYYDEAVMELDYSLWLEFILPYLKPSSTLLDLACGTGTLVTMLRLKGILAEGIDLSEEIIEIAREKAKINHLDIPFYIADMTSFSLDKKYDVITCFFDSVNFLKTTNQIQAMLGCVKKHLNPQGYFIFDIFSKTMLEEYTFNHIQKDYHYFSLDWKTKKDTDTSLKHEIKIQEGDKIFFEEYYEYYHEIKSLNLNGFKLIKICGDFNEDLYPEDERILIVLQAL